MIPIFLSSIIFSASEPNLLKGFCIFAPLVLLYMSFRKQTHRIEHINAEENPFYMGFFMSTFVQNYATFYFYYEDPVGLNNFITMILTLAHTFFFVKMLRMDPGTVHRSAMKIDGSEYELRDLIRIHLKELQTRGSLNVLEGKVSDRDLNDDESQLQFCDTCQIITKKPIKHCKLCEKCCSNFDHHCLFICKCVGAGNHREFLWLLIFSILGIVIYFTHGYFYLKEIIDSLQASDSFFYFIFSHSHTSWLLLLFFTNFFMLVMVGSLLFNQLRVCSNGFTAQFQPFNMHAVNVSLVSRLANIKTFLFGSPRDIESLFERQQRLFNAAPKVKNYPTEFSADENPSVKFMKGLQV